MSRTVLVTGGAGYVGSHACKRLAAAGWLPVTFDDLSRGRRAAVRWGPLVEADLAKREALDAAFREHRPVAVMHFAGRIEVGESMRDPQAFYRANLLNTLNLLDAMLAAGVRLIVFSSTAAVYGHPDQVPIPETAALRPVSPYGETKLAVEQALRWYGAAYGLSSASLRYFNAAGADADGEIGEAHEPETHLIPLALQVALGRRAHIDVYGTDYPTPDGTAVRDYIHVTDLAEAHLLALEYLDRGGETTALNLGVGAGHSVKEVIDAAERISGRPIARRAADRRPGDPPVLVADPSRAKATLGWTPRHSDLETVVRTAWKWHSGRGA